MSSPRDLVKVHHARCAAAMMLVALSVCVGDANTCDAAAPSGGAFRGVGTRSWPAPCDAPLSEHWHCTHARLQEGAVRTMVVLLNSFEKLTWATVGLGRLLVMTNSSASVSLVEPCIADSGRSM